MTPEEEHVVRIAKRAAYANDGRKALSADDVLKRWRWYDDFPPEPTRDDVCAVMVVLTERGELEWYSPPRDVRPEATPHGDGQARVRFTVGGLDSLAR